MKTAQEELDEYVNRGFAPLLKEVPNGREKVAPKDPCAVTHFGLCKYAPATTKCMVGTTNLFALMQKKKQWVPAFVQLEFNGTVFTTFLIGEMRKSGKVQHCAVLRFDAATDSYHARK